MNGDIITIRPETGNDFGEISEVVRLAFRDMPESDHTEHLLVTRLRQSEAYVPDLSLVAEDSNGKIVGHIMLSEVKVISGDGSRTLLSAKCLCGRRMPGLQKPAIRARYCSDTRTITRDSDTEEHPHTEYPFLLMLRTSAAWLPN